MTYIIKLNSFDEVAAKYATTPVLKSKDHPKEQDIRPIGGRRRKWERIIKVDDRTYALSCGGHADPVFHWGWGTSDKLKEYPLQPQDTARLSPIVWRKHKDGTETITIRNGQGSFQHNAIYSFLNRALPQELRFRINRQGRHAIYNRAEGKEYYLPKTKTVPRYVYEANKENAAKNKWYTQRFKDCMVGFDNMSLTFQRTAEGKFVLVGKAPKEMVERKRVLKDDKAKFKKHIDEVYEWALTMYPLMRDQLNWGFREETNKRLRDIAKEHNVEGFEGGWRDLFELCKPQLIRNILAQPDHVMRYEFGLAAMFAIKAAMGLASDKRNWEYKGMSDEDFEALLKTKVRAHYVRWINALAGFTKTIKEEK